MADGPKIFDVAAHVRRDAVTKLVQQWLKDTPLEIIENAWDGMYSNTTELRFMLREFFTMFTTGVLASHVGANVKFTTDSPERSHWMHEKLGQVIYCWLTGTESVETLAPVDMDIQRGYTADHVITKRMELWVGMLKEWGDTPLFVVGLGHGENAKHIDVMSGSGVATTNEIIGVLIDVLMRLINEEAITVGNCSHERGGEKVNGKRTCRICDSFQCDHLETYDEDGREICEACDWPLDDLGRFARDENSDEVYIVQYPYKLTCLLCDFDADTTTPDPLNLPGLASYYNLKMQEHGAQTHGITIDQLNEQKMEHVANEGFIISLPGGRAWFKAERRARRTNFD